MNNLNEELIDFDATIFGTKPEFEIGTDSITLSSNEHIQTDNSGSTSVWIQEKIASWRDPVFQTRSKCVKWAYCCGGKTCIGWKTETRYFTNEVWLTVSSPSYKDLKKAVERALSDATVVAAIIAISTGGAAAISAFKIVFTARLTQEVKDAVVDVQIKGSWGNWS